MNPRLKIKSAVWLKNLILFFYIGLNFILPQNANAASSGHLLISQVQISGGEGKTEYDFIEIFNPVNEKINLKGYRLVKRTEKGIKDASIKSWDKDVFMEPGSYFLWANNEFKNNASAYMVPDSSTSIAIANNNGIALRFGGLDTGGIIDSVAWGEAQNAFIEGNVFSVNPEANKSLERKNKEDFPNAADTNNNANDFIVTYSHPRNSKSSYAKIEDIIREKVTVIPVSDSVSPTAAATIYPSVTPALVLSPTPVPLIYTTYPQDIRINEFLPDPIGNDNEGEWIEIYNNSDKNLDLSGWKIDDEIGSGSASFNLSGITVKAYDYAVLPYKQTKITLNNGGGQVNLIMPDGKVSNSISYKKAPLGESYNFFDNGWYWCKKITPGNKNSVCKPEGKPVDNSEKDVNNNSKTEEKIISSVSNTAGGTKNSSKESFKKTITDKAYDKNNTINHKEESVLYDKKKNKEENIQTKELSDNELKNEEKSGDPSLAIKDSEIAAASVPIDILNNKRRGANIIPYIFLIVGIGIIFALASLKAKELVAEKKRNFADRTTLDK